MEHPAVQADVRDLTGVTSDCQVWETQGPKVKPSFLRIRKAPSQAFLIPCRLVQISQYPPQIPTGPKRAG